SLPHLEKAEDIVITSPIKKEVYGNDTEMLLMAWAFPGITDKSMETLEIVDAMLVNGKAGLIDIDVNKKQRALHMGGDIYGLADKSAYYIIAYPNEGQTLDELRDLVLEEMAKLRAGEFDESLIPATINNYKLMEQRAIESNEGRVDVMQEVFIDGFDPAEYVGKLDRQSKLTKKDITEFAKAHLRDDNYVAIYKLQGQDPNELKIAKQPITPLAVNRDKTSAFLTEILSEEVAPIEPVFLDFDKDLDYLTLNNGIPVLYKQNTTNDIFTLTFVYDFGSLNDPELALLGSYFPLLGTPEMTNDEISQKFYDIACSYRLSIGGNRSYVTISGLSENMPQALALVEDIMNNAKADKDVYAKVAEQLIKDRNDSKLNQNQNFGKLQRYVIYGPQQVKKTTLTNEQITGTNAKALTDKLAGFNGMEHSVIYYGPIDQNT
ncbi:MAG: insulinase family protein, partial [Muribaculaceae bacterium]|nr:insulinase family protein [Muribaculaceae bacterium]